MGNIYLVTQGAYSDYHVVCTFSSESDAREWAKNRNALRRDPSDDYDEYKVEEYEVLDCVPPVRTYWTATFTHWEYPGSLLPEKGDEISGPQRVALDPDDKMPKMGVTNPWRFSINSKALTKDECWQALTEFLTEKFGDDWKGATRRT